MALVAKITFLLIAALLAQGYTLRERRSAGLEDTLMEVVMPAYLPHVMTWHGNCSENLLMPLAHNPRYDIVRSHSLGPCPVKLQVNHKIGRQPASILTASCAPGCARRLCSLQGHFRCQEVTTTVMVTYPQENGEQLHKHEKFPVGCVCASKSSVEVDVTTRSL